MVSFQQVPSLELLREAFALQESKQIVLASEQEASFPELFERLQTGS